MKKSAFLLFFFLILSAARVLAEDNPVKYVDATELRLINRGFETEQMLTPYTRLPRDIADSVRPTLWERSQCSSGIGVRFATDSRSVGVRYRLLWNTHMIHMADTGLKGTDLYIYGPDSTWHYVNTNRPYIKDRAKDSMQVAATYVENLDGEMHEYMIYFPLYDGLTELQVAVDSAAVITPGNPGILRRDAGRIVGYGTSILHGGCASRTGMCPTNIISRELDREVINIGISGEAKLDLPMARALARIPDVSVFLIDPVPNCTLDQCDSLTYGFVSTLLKLRPEVPVLMVEGPMYPYAHYNSYFRDYLPSKNRAFFKHFQQLQNDFPGRVFYVTNTNLDGPEDDGTVDGIHLTDLGFRHYADKITPALRAVLEGKTPQTGVFE